MITVLPDFLAVILPLLETVAYLLAEELHLMPELYDFGFTVAFSVYVFPLYSVKDGLLSLIDVALTDGLSGVTGFVGSAGFGIFTVTLHVAVLLPSWVVTIIFAVPFETAVTLPF